MGQKNAHRIPVGHMTNTAQSMTNGVYQSHHGIPKGRTGHQAGVCHGHSGFFIARMGGGEGDGA